MASKKTGRVLIKMTSKESDHIYWTTKNKKNTKDRLTAYKYAPDVRKKLLFKED